jgi:hypothetical protein
MKVGTVSADYYDEELRMDFIEITTPLKSGNIVHNNFNWFRDLESGKDDNIDKLRKQFENAIANLKTLTSGGPRKYTDNTIQVFNLIYPD